MKRALSARKGLCAFDASGANPRRLPSVPLPYLQIVCHGFWNQSPPGPDLPFLSGYLPNQAKAQLDDYCRIRLEGLSDEEKDAACDAFGYLITRGGAKRACPFSELADLIDSSSSDVLDRALRKLAHPQARILRGFRDPENTVV
jgi:hypothetical protein